MLYEVITVGGEDALGVELHAFDVELRVAEAHRITSYNVCYTKLLRCLLATMSVDNEMRKRPLQK